MSKIVKSNITAVILAGGKGRRLGGQDKGLVHYKNKPLIEHVIERIKPQVDMILINANRNQESYASYGYPVISDELSNFQGPLAGFATAMKTVASSHIVTLPCDGPLLPNNLVSRMLEKLVNTPNASSETLVVAHNGERLQPVYALIPVNLIDSLERFLEEGNRKIDLWYDRHSMQIADFSDIPNAFDNINTEEQRKKLEVDAYGNKGLFQKEHLVYGRKKEPCRVCKTTLEYIKVCQRGTVFCPNCQKL